MKVLLAVLLGSFLAGTVAAAEAEKISFSVTPYYVWNSEAAESPLAKALPARNPNELGLEGRLCYSVNDAAQVEAGLARGLDSKLTRVTVGVRWKLF